VPGAGQTIVLGVELGEVGRRELGGLGQVPEVAVAGVALASISRIRDGQALGDGFGSEGLGKVNGSPISAHPLVPEYRNQRLQRGGRYAV